MAIERTPDANRVKVVVEHVEDGYIAYPLGLKGVVVGQGNSYQEALSDVRSAIYAHVKEFGIGSITWKDQQR